MEVVDSCQDYLKHKPTTQNAILEKPLSWLRSKAVRPYCTNKAVLDFGCGAGLVNLRTLVGTAASLAGFDQLFTNRETTQTPEGFTLYGNYEALPENSFDVITALAVFEHIEPPELPVVLKHLKKALRKGGLVIGTVPTPAGQPVLEFLSYKLKLIDETQIRDHKIYYDKLALTEQFRAAGLRLLKYRTFQFGMNSFFVTEVCKDEF